MWAAGGFGVIFAVMASGLPYTKVEDFDLGALPELWGTLSRDDWAESLLLAVDRDLANERRVRVRVFPHFKDYQPHLREIDQKRVQTESPGRCTIASLDPQLSLQERILSRHLPGETLSFDLRSWDGAFLVACEQEVTLIRKGRGHHRYHGHLVFRAMQNSKRGAHLEVVNFIGLEDYLMGVLPAEVYPFWPDEALKSQAVAARTYLGFHLNHGNLSHKARYDVDDTILYQAYTGLDDRTERTDQAVRDTAGEVITFRGKLAQALYHADSGGSTDDAAAIFGANIPYCKGKKEPYPQSMVKSTRWQESLSLAEFESRLRLNQILESKERLHHVEPQSFSRGGRILSLRVLTRQGRDIQLSASLLQKIVPLKSSKFVIKVSNDIIVFSGKGSGHGVGLSQKGAKVLAGAFGWDYHQILDHYYSGTHLCMLDQRWGIAVESCRGRVSPGPMQVLN